MTSCGAGRPVVVAQAWRTEASPKTTGMPPVWRGSARARRQSSGPTPAGSPMVIARRGSMNGERRAWGARRQAGAKKSPAAVGTAAGLRKGRRGSVAGGGLAEFAEGGAFGFVDLAVFVGVEAIAEGFAGGFSFWAFAGGGADAVFHFFASGGLFRFVEFAVAVLIESLDDFCAVGGRGIGGGIGFGEGVASGLFFGVAEFAVFVGVEALEDAWAGFFEEFFEIGEGLGTAFGAAEAGAGFGGVVGFAAVEAFAGFGGCGFAFVVAEGAVAVLVETFEHFADAVDWAALRAGWAGGFGWIGGRGDRLGGGVVRGE